MRDAYWYARWVRMLPAETTDEKFRNLEAADLLESLSNELEQVKRERDAAVEDMELMGEYRPYCQVCAHVNSDSKQEPCFSCCEGYMINNWQWRGAKEEQPNENH